MKKNNGLEVELVSENEAVVHTLKLGSFYVIQKTEEIKEINWITQSQNHRVYVMQDTYSSNLDEAIIDVVSLYENGYLIDWVYNFCNHAVKEWNSIPEDIQNTYDMLKKYIRKFPPPVEVEK